MSWPVVTIAVEADLHDAFALLRTYAVRWLVMLRGEEFVGMIMVEDLLMDLATIWLISAGR